MTSPTPTPIPSPIPSPIPTRAAAPEPARPQARWSAGRAVLVVLGVLGALGALALLVTSGALALAANGRDDGYLTAGDAPLHSAGHAITVRQIGVQVSGPDVATSQDLLGRVRVRADGGTGKPLFVGIARRADADRYLAGVRADEVLGFELDPFAVSYRQQGGNPPDGRPGDQPFWAASDAGTGRRELLWDIAPGDWAVVVMNADGSAGVEATLGVGASLPGLRIFAIGFAVTGGAVLVAATVLIAAGLRPRRRPAAVPAGPAR